MLKKNIGIRAYKSSDALGTYQLFYDTVRNINAKDYTQEQVEMWAPHDKDLSEWNKSLINNFSFVAEDTETGVMLGFCDLEKNGYLNRGFVHKDCQKIGIGSMLLKVREDKAQALGLTKIFSHVSITARPFFEAKGFHVVKQQTVTICDVAFINFVMEKIVRFV